MKLSYKLSKKDSKDSIECDVVLTRMKITEMAVILERTYAKLFGDW